jgi:hypothetical protein
MSTPKIGRPVGAKNLTHKGKYAANYAERLAKSFRKNGDAKDFPTFERFAVDVGVSIQVLRDWFAAYPAFATACEAAFTAQQAMLLTIIQANGPNAEFAKLFIQQPPFWKTAK